MNHLKTVYFSDRLLWRQWLEKNFDIKKEIWMVFPKKPSGKPRIAYNDAVEEALCFGWIDSTVKSLGKHNMIQRFSTRKPGSKYSQANKERLKWLLRENMLHPSVHDAVKRVLKEKFVYPADVLKAIRKNKTAWNNFNHFSGAYKRIRIAYINSARKRTGEFQKRLKNFIHKTAKNKVIGFGGIEKVY